jgi:hypothetical protein
VSCIAYKSGYKYQLKADYVLSTPVIPDTPVDTDYFGLTKEGVLRVKKGYAWDGPSGPTVDTQDFMRGSLVHDVFYQLMREGFISNQYKDTADRLLQFICVEDGMSALRAWFVYQGVRIGGAPAIDPASTKPIIKAPKNCKDE